jgi:isoquinoline 1-oxidoreductase beta subunit
VAFSQNVFFVESFMDEIASATNQDPMALRLALLEHKPRLAQAIRLAGTKAAWGAARPGLHQGLAAYDFHGTSVAMIAEVPARPDRRIQVHRIVCALDCGTVINPGIVKSQIEGGIAFGLTAALKGEITFTEGRVDQGNFDDFPLLRMDEMPVVEVHLVPSGEPPTGIGESAVPPAAPAVANAVFKATGKRVRDLPLRI